MRQYLIHQACMNVKHQIKLISENNNMREKKHRNFKNRKEKEECCPTTTTCGLAKNHKIDYSDCHQI